MDKYYYCANTFQSNEPIQVEGYVDAENEQDVIQFLIRNGVLDPRSFEFLELHKLGQKFSTEDEWYDFLERM